MLGTCLSERTSQKEKIKNEILNEIETVVDICCLNGFMKIWLYQFCVLYHFSWPLLIPDLDKSFAFEIQRLRNPTLKFQGKQKKMTMVFISGQTQILDSVSLVFLTVMKKCSSSNVSCSKTQSMNPSERCIKQERKLVQSSPEFGKRLALLKLQVLKSNWL